MNPENGTLIETFLLKRERERAERAEAALADWQNDPRTKMMDAEIAGAMDDKARAEAALAEAQKDIEALAYGRNAALKREAKARGLLERWLDYSADRWKVAPVADTARFLAGRPAPAECDCSGRVHPSGLGWMHANDCATRADPRPAPAECEHDWLRRSDGDGGWYEECAKCKDLGRASWPDDAIRADPRPVKNSRSK